MSLPGIEARLLRPVLNLVVKTASNLFNISTEIILFSASVVATLKLLPTLHRPAFTVFLLLILGVNSSIFIVDVDPAVEFLDDVGRFAVISEVHAASIILTVR